MPEIIYYLTLSPPELFQALNIHKGQVTCFNTTPVCNVFKQGVVMHMTQECGSDTNMHQFRTINSLCKVGVLSLNIPRGWWYSICIYKEEGL